MASAAQIEANRANAQRSTGPRSEAGKEASSRNNLRHGLTAHGFFFLEWESAEHFDVIKKRLADEYKPATATEHLLVEKMTQAYWLAQRAQSLYTMHMSTHPVDPEVHEFAARYIRHQSHHERVFQRTLNELLKLRAERRKEQIGFELQKSREAQETRREAAENRKVEQHQKTIQILDSRVKREQNKAMQAEIETADKMYKSLGPEAAEMIAGTMQKRAA